MLMKVGSVFQEAIPVPPNNPIIKGNNVTVRYTVRYYRVDGKVMLHESRYKVHELHFRRCYSVVAWTPNGVF